MSSYKAYYFGEDGSYKQDQTNFGLGIGVGTYNLIGTDSLQVNPSSGGGIAGGTMKAKIYLLTNDSLVFFSQGLRLSKNNPN